MSALYLDCAPSAPDSTTIPQNEPSARKAQRLPVLSRHASPNVRSFRLKFREKRVRSGLLSHYKGSG
eukprot:5560329-Amphidinium_carterae.1